MTQQELAEFYEANPDIKKKQDKTRRDLKKAEEQGPEAEPSIKGEEVALEDGDRAKIDALAAESDASFMADIIAEYKEEKAQLVEENIHAAAEELATPETRPLYRQYLRLLYQRNARGNGDQSYHTQWIISRLTKPNGWRGTFPTLKVGPLPPGVAGLWSGGAITLIGLDIVVLSHEWYHHTDNANGMDGNSHRHEQPEPWEKLAYAEMGREI